MSVKEFLKKKDIIISPRRYCFDALSQMAQAVFASLLIGLLIMNATRLQPFFMGMIVSVIVGLVLTCHLYFEDHQYTGGCGYGYLRICRTDFHIY